MVGRRLRLHASLIVLLALAGIPVVAAVCALACQPDHGSAGLARPACHEASTGDLRVSPATADPCEDHRTGIAEIARRPPSTRDVFETAAAPALVHARPARLDRVTARPDPGAPGSRAPSRSPLVLRL